MILEAIDDNFALRISYESILDTDYTDYTVAVYKNNSVIRVICV